MKLFPIKVVENNALFLKGGLLLLTSFQKLEYWKVEKGTRSDFTVENDDKHYFNQEIKVNTNSDKSCWQYVPLICCDKNDTLSPWSSSQEILAQCNHEKEIRELHVSDSLQSAWPALFKTVWLTKTRQVRNCHTQEQLKRHDNYINVTCCPRDPG